LGTISLICIGLAHGPIQGQHVFLSFLLSANCWHIIK
jgi:hypothetical protein